MKKKHTYLLACLAMALIAGVYWFNQHSNSAAKVGTLELPFVTRLEDDVEILGYLLAIDVAPYGAFKLKNEDRRPFLQVVQTLLAGTPARKKNDLFLSKGAVVWLVIQENWPASREWFENPAVVSNGSVSIKLIGERILTLHP